MLFPRLNCGTIADGGPSARTQFDCLHAIFPASTVNPAGSDEVPSIVAAGAGSCGRGRSPVAHDFQDVGVAQMTGPAAADGLPSGRRS